MFSCLILQHFLLWVSLTEYSTSGNHHVFLDFFLISTQQQETKRTSQMVKKPLGWIWKQFITDNLKETFLCYRKSRKHHTWKFYMDQALRLNITFQTIYIAYMNLYECFTGHVLVESFLSGMKFQYRYCGMLSNIINYPPHFRTEVVIVAAARVRYEVIMSYSIIDKNRIVLNFKLPFIQIPSWSLNIDFIFLSK